VDWKNSTGRQAKACANFCVKRAEHIAFKAHMAISQIFSPLCAYWGNDFLAAPCCFARMQWS
jgi:hypothetical protein